jgi:hypothetical protein
MRGDLILSPLSKLTVPLIASAQRAASQSLCLIRLGHKTKATSAVLAGKAACSFGAQNLVLVLSPSLHSFAISQNAGIYPSP